MIYAGWRCGQSTRFSMDEFRFAHAWAFPLLIAAGWVIWKGRWRRRLPARLYGDVRLTRTGIRSWKVRLHPLPDTLRVAAWCLLVVALARPQAGTAQEVIRGEGIDIVFALDVSGSMAALDFQPLNRLEAAKDVIADFVAGREFDRIGVVIYARAAYTLVPLTLDYQTVRSALDGVRLISELRTADGEQALDGTASGVGLLASAALMRESTVRSKVIILLTDGATNSGVDLSLAAEAAAALGIRVFTIGVGRRGQVPAPDGEGNITMIESDLDESALQRAADIGGGRYFSAADSASLAAAASAIDRLERTPVRRQVYIPWRDWAPALLAAALICLLAEWTLRAFVLDTAP
ncbi:MAG: aerotolerance regulator BatA [Chloroflexi bacterium]|nr:MAG: aerotolerance regulator BatA [Chloroflexota bacterium]